MFLKSFLSKSLGSWYDVGGGEEVLLVNEILLPKPKQVVLLFCVEGKW